MLCEEIEGYDPINPGACPLDEAKRLRILAESELVEVFEDYPKIGVKPTLLKTSEKRKKYIELVCTLFVKLNYVTTESALKNIV